MEIQFSYKKTRYLTLSPHSGESRANREREFNGYFRQQFHIRHSLPAVFIDNYPDDEDFEEHEATMSELRALKSYAEKMEEFKCEDAQVKKLKKNTTKHFYIVEALLIKKPTPNDKL